MRKTILITGGSTGIGAAVARLAARQGYDVALTYHSSKDAAEAVARDVRAAGARAEVFCTDVAQPAQIDALFADFDAAFGQLDVLVNNAGIVDLATRVDEIDAERLHRIFDTNVIGAFLVAGHAVRRMSSRYGKAGGVIVNISSAAARLGAPGTYVDYAASKGAIDTMTRGLADEVVREGIRVLGLRPGIIDTAIHAKGGIPDRADVMGAQVPMGRKGSADEVAEAVIWLASDKASYMTGTTIDVTGGR